MSRVTKLRKQYRTQRRAEWRRRLRARAKSNRLLCRQSDYFASYSITSRQRRDARQRSHHRCNCGHRLHGLYGCLHGCAWNACDGVTFEPILRGPRDSQFVAEGELATLAILTAFRLPRI